MYTGINLDDWAMNQGHKICEELKPELNFARNKVDNAFKYEFALFPSGHTILSRVVIL